MAPPAGRLLRLPEADDVAFRIGHPGECACKNLDRRHECLSAERGSARQIGLRVVHLHIHRNVIVGPVTQRGDVTLNSAPPSGFYHHRGTDDLHLSAEELRIELRRAGYIAAANLKMDHGLYQLFFSEVDGETSILGPNRKCRAFDAYWRENAPRGGVKIANYITNSIISAIILFLIIGLIAGWLAGKIMGAEVMA